MKKKYHISISISDTAFRYVVVDRDQNGFFVPAYGETFLEEGIVVKGEIIKASALLDVITSFKKNLPDSSVSIYSLVLPHQYFIHDSFLVAGVSSQKQKNSAIQQYLGDNIQQYPWAENHSCLYQTDEHDMVYVEALPHERYQSYITLLSSCGIDNVEVHSDISAVSVMVKDSPSVVIKIDNEKSYVFEINNGFVESKKTFELSYQSLVSDVVKFLGVDLDFARKVVRKYGVSRAHQEPKVYQRIVRSVSPLLDYLKVNKSTRKKKIYLWFSHEPLVGMKDVLTKQMHTEINVISPVHNEIALYHEVLDIHMDDTYRYSALLLTASLSMNGKL